MPLEESYAHHHVWSADENPLELPIQSKLWLLVGFVLVSFLCIGYVFWVVTEKERTEQKNK